MALLKEDLAGEIRYSTSLINSHDITLRVFKQGGSLRYEIGVEMWPSAEGYTSWSQFCTNAELNDTIQSVTGLVLPWETPGGTVDSGVIVMWSGLLANIPTGWVLCNGANGTPDLRDKFIKGAANGANPGDTGGSASHSHTYDDVIQHTHSISVNDPGHTHVEQNNSTTTGPNAGWGARDTSTNNPVATGYSTQSATTGITASSVDPTGSVAQGTTDTADSRPPYYALAFIQKV